MQTTEIEVTKLDRIHALLLKNAEHKEIHPSVESGALGKAIYFGYAWKFYDSVNYKEIAEEKVEAAFDILNTMAGQSKFEPQYLSDSLSNVFGSFGKGLLFLQHKFNIGNDFRDQHIQLKEILKELCFQSLEFRDFDFFSGALACGYYYLNHYYYYKDEFSRKMLLSIYEGIHSSITVDNGLYYWTSPSLANMTYLGLSHGSAMIINFISKLITFRILPLNLRNKMVLIKSIEGILAFQRDYPEGFFPNRVLEKSLLEKETPLGLTYGDLGVLFALQEGNEHLKDQELNNTIDKMFTQLISREKKIEQTYDAGIFYGASGIWWTLNRQIEKGYLPELFSHGKKYWLSELLNGFVSSDNSNAGFRNIYSKESRFNSSAKESFGWGLQGIGITIMKEIRPSLPSIDELLLTGI